LLIQNNLLGKIKMMTYKENLDTELTIVQEEDVQMAIPYFYAEGKKEVIKKEESEKVTNLSTLYNGDCIKGMKNIQSCSIDLIITDPPYNLGNFMHERNTNLVKMRDNHFAYSDWDNLEHSEWVEKMDDFFKESNRLLKKKGSLLMFMSLMKVETLIKLAQKYKFYYKTIGIWHKTNPMPRNMNLHFINSTECWIYFINEGTTGTFNNNGIVVHDFIETGLTPASEKKYGKHPTQKPIQLINHFIKLLSNPNDIILDPFMGSGSTGVGCELLNRKFIGIELDKNYYEIAKKRLKNTNFL
jgi:site-specific DNA-methyltransferase (adenine-specific)